MASTTVSERIILCLFMLTMTVSIAHGTTAATLRYRPSQKILKLHRANRKLIQISLTLNQAVSTEQATKLQVSNPFQKGCPSDGSCTWVATPWPFPDIAMDRDSGKIAGTPRSAWSKQIHVTAVNDDTRKVYEAEVLIQVVPGPKDPPAIISSSLYPEPVGQPLSEHFSAIGGTRPYTWSIEDKDPGNNPPPGVSVDSNGEVTGTPTTAGSYRFKVQVKDANYVEGSGKDPSSREVDMTINAAPDCDNPKYDGNRYFNGFFPLSRERNTNPLGDARHGAATDYDVQCFWGSSGLLAPLSQVRYIYGFGGGTSTISTDMLSVQMPAPVGMQVSLGTSVTGGGSSTTVQALQAVEAGGDFYIHAEYPIAVFKNNRVTALLTIDPKVGFNFNGFAGQATLSQATEQYISAPVEVYGEYAGLANAGGPYIDYRGGFESVPSPFATAANLSHHNFKLQQLSLGFNFAGLMKIGAQRFFGPSEGFNVSGVNDFNKWHFVIQLSPRSN